MCLFPLKENQMKGHTPAKNQFPQDCCCIECCNEMEELKQMLFLVLNVLLLQKHLGPWFYVLAEIVGIKTGKILQK